MLLTSDINPEFTENIFDNSDGPEGKTIDESNAPVYTAAEYGYTSEKIFLNITNATGITISYTVERV